MKRKYNYISATHVRCHCGCVCHYKNMWHHIRCWHSGERVRRHTGLITCVRCGEEREHYAREMCDSCYHIAQRRRLLHVYPTMRERSKDTI